MCGIAGVFSARTFCADEAARLETAVGRMEATLDARGPDQRGRYVDAGRGVVLGHTRLAILDLTEAGRQPMWSNCGRYAIVYNGEIYNFTEIRRSLERRGVQRFRTATDTEVLLEAIAHWGVERALNACNGMFAFGLFDRERNELTLARDRFGKKPLYYRVGRSGVWFASEVGALIEGSGTPGEIDPMGVGAYLAYGFVPQDVAIHRDMHSVAAGTLIRFARADGSNSMHDLGGGLRAETQTYFDVFQLAEEALYMGVSIEAEDLETDIGGALRRAVVHRTRADVPVGLMLSGGVDSALVAAVASDAEIPVTAFTMGFEQPDYDETARARAVATHFGLDHQVETVSAADAERVAQDCVERFDEPFADQSLIPTVLLCEMVGREVKVCLSGDGGDELFGGYGKYQLFERLDRQLALIPGWMRAALAALLDPASETACGIWPKTAKGQRAFKALRAVRDFESLGRMALTRSPMINRFVAPEARPAVRAGQARLPGATVMTGIGRIADVAETGTLLQLLDQATYLTDNILRKTDRASMARSLEVRNPLLDRDVVGIAWRLNNHPQPQPKAPLLRQLEGRLPEELRAGAKRGFSPPMAEWLTGGLRGWAGDQLDTVTRRFDTVLDRDAVMREWHRSQRGTMNKMQAQEFWTLIMLNCIRSA